VREVEEIEEEEEVKEEREEEGEGEGEEEEDEEGEEEETEEEEFEEEGEEEETIAVLATDSLAVGGDSLLLSLLILLLSRTEVLAFSQLRSIMRWKLL